MNIGISFDMSDYELQSAMFLGRLEVAKITALGVVSDEILRLSQQEVPFLSGELMSSGVSQPNGDEYIVGYNKVYAAYMHEGHWYDGSHNIEQYSNGRKGHYLIDPIILNKEILNIYFGEKLNEVLMVGA